MNIHFPFSQLVLINFLFCKVIIVEMLHQEVLGQILGPDATAAFLRNFGNFPHLKNVLHNTSCLITEWNNFNNRYKPP